MDILSCFYFLAIMNNAIVNIYVQVCVATCFHFSWAVPMSGIAGLYNKFTFNFLRSIQHIFQSGYIKGQFYCPNSQAIEVSIMLAPQDW